MANDNSSAIVLINEETIRDRIYVVRGQKVMLDFELASIYGYETKNFNRQVKNNSAKFDGEDFMFQLTADELKILRCKNSTSSWGGSRYLPYAFTEQGIYMLMTVLRGDLAIRQSKALILNCFLYLIPACFFQWLMSFSSTSASCNICMLNLQYRLLLLIKRLTLCYNMSDWRGYHVYCYRRV